MKIEGGYVVAETPEDAVDHFGNAMTYDEVQFNSPRWDKGTISVGYPYNPAPGCRIRRQLAHCTPELIAAAGGYDTEFTPFL